MIDVGRSRRGGATFATDCRLWKLRELAQLVLGGRRGIRERIEQDLFFCHLQKVSCAARGQIVGPDQGVDPIYDRSRVATQRDPNGWPEYVSPSYGKPRRRAKLLGATSYGKGSVQIWYPLTGESGAVRVTIAKWLTPNGNTIHEVGLTPDYPVELTEEDRAADRDPQLDEAVRILLEMIGQ
ncbi:MAG: hypothetical protein DCC59_17870 [Chloroflexi bacterium]|nr:MAG: hypothetical protein DCC59_17870 [Chloroflexota bacterium]